MESKELQGIKVITPRLTQHDAINIYETPYLPLIHHEYPLFAKLVRLSHLRYSATKKTGSLVYQGHSSKSSKIALWNL